MNPLVLFAFIGLASAALIPESRDGGFIGYQIPVRGAQIGLGGPFYPLGSGLTAERGVAGNEGIIQVVGKPLGVQTEGIQGVKEVKGLYLGAAPQYTEAPLLKTEIPVVAVEKVAKPIMTEQTVTEVPVVQLYKPVRDLGNVESELFRQIPVGQKYYGQQIHRAFPYLFGGVYGERTPVYRQEYPFYGKHMSSYVYGQEYPEMYRREYPLNYDAYPFRTEYPIYGKQYQDKPYVYGYPYYGNELQYVQPEHQIYQRHELPLNYEHVSYPYRSGYQYVL